MAPRRSLGQEDRQLKLLLAAVRISWRATQAGFKTRCVLVRMENEGEREVAMNVEQLIERLQGCEPETEVRLAMQPSWPFEYSVSDVQKYDPNDLYEIVMGDYNEGQSGWYVIKEAWMDEDGDGPMGPYETTELAEEAMRKEQASEGSSDSPVVYLSEGSQLGYLPGDVREMLCW